MHSDALGRHCALVTEPDPELPLVEANQVQLQQVLLNLVVNAFEAMRETPAVERRVIIRSEREPDGRVRVSVRDFGTGLPAEEPQRIFEQFFSTKREGMGMGLAIARSIITSHGGELAAANARAVARACISRCRSSRRVRTDEEHRDSRREAKRHERAGTARLRGG